MEIIAKFEYIIIILSLVLSFYYFFFHIIISNESTSKGSNLLLFMVFVGLLGANVAMLIPHNSIKDYSASYRVCFSSQRVIHGAIQMYESELGKKFPTNLLDEEIFKYAKNILVEEKFLKEPIQRGTAECIFKYEDSDFFCYKHGSYDEKSSHYTSGKELKDYSKYKNIVDEKIKEKNSQVKQKETKEWLIKLLTYIDIFLLGISIIHILYSRTKMDTQNV